MRPSLFGLVPRISHPMTNDALVTVGQYDTQGDAQLAKTQLEAADIPCMLSNEDQAGLASMFDSTRSGVKLKVPADRADEARSVLDRT